MSYRFKVLAVVMILFVAAGCASKPTQSSIVAGRVLAQNRCTGCHPPANFTKHRYGRAEWLAVINRMMGHGAQFTQEEQSSIADYLSVRYGR